MKPLQQFLALLRFQAFATPRIWIFPVAFSFQPYFSLMTGDTWWGLSLPLSSSTMLFMISMMEAAFVFTPELWTGMTGATQQAQQNLQGCSPDFILTRAVDRPVVFFARAALFWILVLLPAIVLLGVAAWRPSIAIEVRLPSPGDGAVYLETLPGASVTKTTSYAETISSPTGRLAIVGTLVLLSIACSAFWQGFVFAISGFKYKRWLFYTAVVGVVGSPFLMLGGRSRSLETLVFLILKHPVAAVGLTGAFVVAVWAFSAARAKRIEYP